MVCRDSADLARKAADRFIALALDAMARSGRFAVALSGGSTPRELYALLGSFPYKDRLDWTRVHLFWGDERCVPPDHPESNFGMVRSTLLSQVSIPAPNIHRMAGEKVPEEGAAEYERELRGFFGSTISRFDLILLGIGEDGHTASLFPDSEALDEGEHLVAAIYLDKLRSWRLTLTYPAINAAAEIAFLAAGKNKSPIVKDLLGPDANSSNYPAARVRPVNGRLTWFVTEDAAHEGFALRR